MREHQVVINLKREQFEEVHRLARLAGSRSPSAYLRDRILNLLGMEQAEHGQKDAGSAQASSDLNSVNQELSRMHRELQVFIAESLSSGSYLFSEGEPGGFEEPYPPYIEVERQLELAQEVLASQGKPAGATTFGAQATGSQGADYSSTSMATGSGESTQSASEQSPGYRGGTTEPFETSGGASQAGYTGYGSTKFSGTGSRGTIGSRMASFLNASKQANLFSSGLFDTRQLSDSGVWMTPDVDNMAANPSLGLPPGVGREEPVDQVSDELEELADRAFAISPRLGTTEEPRARAELRVSDDDPLRDLLDDTLVEHIQQAPDEPGPAADESSSSVVYAALPDEPIYGTQMQAPEESTATPEEEKTQAYGSFRANEVWGSESLAAQGFGEGADSDTAAQAGSDTTAAHTDSDTTADTSESDTTATGVESSFPNDQDEEDTGYQSAQIYTGDETPAPARPPMDAPPPKRKKPASDSEDSHDVSGGPPPKRRRKPH